MLLYFLFVYICLPIKGGDNFTDSDCTMYWKVRYSMIHLCASACKVVLIIPIMIVLCTVKCIIVCYICVHLHVGW